MLFKVEKSDEAEKLIDQINSKELNTRRTISGETALMRTVLSGLDRVSELLISRMSDQAINTVSSMSK